MRSLLFFSFVIFLCVIVVAQDHEIAVGSKGNIINLEIVNESSVDLEEVLIFVESLPQFVKLINSDEVISNLNIGQKKQFTFQFDIEQNAPYYEKGKIIFRIFDGRSTYFKSVNIVTSRPENFSLEQNYPNPFNPTTRLKFNIANPGIVTLKVYHVLGSEVATLVNEENTPGVYNVEFNASGLSSGVYYYTLTAKGYIATKKLLLMK